MSKLENGSGEMAYQEVVRTFKSPQKEVIYKIEYENLTTLKNIHERRDRGEKISGRDATYFGYLFCTANHPFWLVNNSGSGLHKGEWVVAELSQGALLAVSGDDIEMQIPMPVRTLPNFPAGYAYFQGGLGSKITILSDKLLICR